MCLAEGLKASGLKEIRWRASPVEVGLKRDPFITEQCCMEAGGRQLSHSRCACALGVECQKWLQGLGLLIKILGLTGYPFYLQQRLLFKDFCMRICPPVLVFWSILHPHPSKKTSPRLNLC